METRLLIRGEQVEGDGRGLSVENPATEENLTELRGASPEQVDAAVAGAREAARGWAATPAVERAEMLHEVATRMRAMTEELAGALTSEGGKPLIENETRWAGPRPRSTTTRRWDATSPVASFPPSRRRS
jgi:acyl-CoA reductase-like NAD-dependent aldehyde dehydrogenase